ncbi:MAG: DUF4159 domain-containing protein [Bacteroidales bacterium]|nr:DUF4159 domain-containing protein [Bacteroidales bacterium]
MKKILLIGIILLAGMQLPAQREYQIALLKYRGGGDWYANPTSLGNLVKFCNEQLHTGISEQVATVEAGSQDIFNYPFVHMTGHGNVVFDASEAQNIRNYLISGGFLHIDDNYGLDPFIRPQMKLVFPELDFVELPFDHPVYHQRFNFPAGLPKIHEHDGKPAQGFGLIYDGRLVCFYSYECDLGDGWENIEVHNDPQATRLQALQMGANLIQYVFSR